MTAIVKLDVADDRIRQCLTTGVLGERLDRFKRDSGDEISALRLYVWNIEIGAAFYCPLQILEIALRNAIHRELSADHGNDWWDRTDINLDWRALQLLENIKNIIENQRREVTSVNIVSELTFGFWVKLLGPGRRNAYDQHFWRKSLYRAFPHARTDPRVKVFERAKILVPIEKLNTLRNRIAHHHPIYHEDLSAHLASIKMVCSWIDQALPEVIDALERCTPLLACLTKTREGLYAVSPRFIA